VCRQCAEEGGAEPFPLRCDRCGSLDVDVVAGEELHVVALELEELEPVKI